MGLFSWKCRNCAAAIASASDFTNTTNLWMGDAIALKKDGSPLVWGHYDGYGRIDCALTNKLVEVDRGANAEHCYPDKKFKSIANPEIYHLDCYLASGAQEHREPSTYDSGQGGFTESLPDNPKPAYHRAIDSWRTTAGVLLEELGLDYLEEASDLLLQEPSEFQTIVKNLLPGDTSARVSMYQVHKVSHQAAGLCGIHPEVMAWAATREDRNES